MYYCNKAIQLKNSSVVNASYFLRAKCKSNLKDYRGAINDFDTYLLLDPKASFRYVYLLRGDAKLELSNKKGALEDYLKFSVLNPTEYYAFYQIGLIKFNDFKDKKGACDAWSKAGELGSKKAYNLIEEFCN